MVLYYNVDLYILKLDDILNLSHFNLSIKQINPINMSICCVVVDADRQSICLLDDSIKQFNQIDLVAKFDNPLKASTFLTEHNVDFVFIAPEFKNAFIQQAISKFKNKPLFVMTETGAENDHRGLNATEADYVLNPLGYADFFQAITAMRQSNSQ